ncbi:MAG: hypothetical protein SFU25_00760 [Candidatus Caenarcaniphilales bacterium]|nr:hypothetical protein [Candidatus Caenarcaniphilales bacterium]
MKSKLIYKTSRKFSGFKNLLSKLLVLVLFIGHLAPSKLLAEEETVLQGSVERLVPSGTPVKLKIISTPIKQELYLERWNVEGDFIPPQEGDQIISELTEPVFVEGDLVIPKKTQFFGVVSKVIAPKKFGKDGRIMVSFEGLRTPRGKFLKFEDPSQTLSGSALSKTQKLARGAVRVGTYAVGGATAGVVAAGALVATNVGSLLLASVQPQYIFGTGAGIGLLVGVVASVIKKGKPGTLMPGDEIQINLERSVVLPISEPIQEQPSDEFSVNGLAIKILNKKLIQDGLGKPVMVIDLEVNNQTNKVLYANDFIMFGPYGRTIYPGGLSLESLREDSPFMESLSMKQFKPRETKKGQVAFEVDYPGFEHLLGLKERSSQSLIYKSSMGFPSEFAPKTKKGKLKEKLFGGHSDPWN